MISTGTIAIPRYVESLSGLYLGNFTADLLNGILSPFVAPNSQGDIFANFIQNPIRGLPHGVTGLIRLLDGNAQPILHLPAARMQFELGAKDGGWDVIDSYSANGIDAISDREFFFLSRGADPGDPRSLIVEFAVSDQPSLLKAHAEIGAWALASAK